MDAMTYQYDAGNMSTVVTISCRRNASSILNRHHIHICMYVVLHTYTHTSAPVFRSDGVDIGGQEGREQAHQDAGRRHHQREAHRTPTRIQ